MLCKNSGKKSIPRLQPNQNKEMKIADSVLLSLFMRDHESATSLTLPSTGLSGIQCIGVIDPEGP